MSALLASRVEVCMCMSVQAAFTAKELREITKLPGVQVHIPQEAMQLTEADRAEMKASRIKKRVYDILKTACEAPASGQALPLLDTACCSISCNPILLQLRLGHQTCGDEGPLQMARCEQSYVSRPPDSALPVDM